METGGSEGFGVGTEKLCLMSVHRRGRACVEVEAEELWLMSVNRQGRACFDLGALKL